MMMAWVNTMVFLWYTTPYCVVFAATPTYTISFSTLCLMPLHSSQPDVALRQLQRSLLLCIYAISPIQAFKLLYQEGKYLIPSCSRRILDIFILTCLDPWKLLSIAWLINWFLHLLHYPPLSPEGFPQTVRMEANACGYHALHYTVHLRNSWAWQDAAVHLWPSPGPTWRLQR